MGSRRKVTQGAENAKAMPRVLVFAQPSAGTEDLLRGLELRTDLCLLRVSTVGAARVALQDVAVDLVVIGPVTDPETLSAIVQSVQDLHPRTPVLALGAESHLAQGRASPTLACLRGSVSPEILNRTVDVALGLRTIDPA
jgi:hypothetical protein